MMTAVPVLVPPLGAAMTFGREQSHRTPVEGLRTSDRVLGAQTEFAVGLGMA
jgi:hypothetical protein